MGRRRSGRDDYAEDSGWNNTQKYYVCRGAYSFLLQRYVDKCAHAGVARFLSAGDGDFRSSHGQSRQYRRGKGTYLLCGRSKRKSDERQDVSARGLLRRPRVGRRGQSGVCAQFPGRQYGFEP